jgi:hypothetical protein
VCVCVNMSNVCVCVCVNMSNVCEPSIHTTLHYLEGWSLQLGQQLIQLLVLAFVCVCVCVYE